MATSLDPQLDRVKVDRGQIEQVLLNLAVNARDAMPSGGKLEIETRNIELDKDWTRTRPGVRPGSYVRLNVTDSGIGIMNEFKHRIFEPFFTTKEPGHGTGLGLAVVHGIVQQSEGHIEVDSKPGRGSSFKIYFPRTEQTAQVSKTTQDHASIPRGDETILLVEDDAAVRALTERILRNAGYTVLEAGNGEEAERICASHRASIHLLLTDVVMPGLAGPKLTERLLMAHPEMKVLFMSGYTDDAVIRHGVLREEVNFIQKPFSPDELAAKVRRVLG